MGDNPNCFTLLVVMFSMTPLSLVKVESAIRHRLIRPHYQPIVELSTGAVRGFEALARWPDQELGMISPARFVPTMERLGLIEQLTQSMMIQILNDLPTIQSYFPNAGLSFNISNESFEGHGLLDFLSGLKREFGHFFPLISLEIIESQILASSKHADQFLRDFSSLGLKLSIDDFGKDYSSHLRLIEFKFDGLKIDQDFVRHLETSPRAKVVVKNMIDLGRDLGMTCTAEGIETELQKNLLGELGCHYGQGWLFSKDLPLAELPSLKTGSSELVH